MIPDLPLRTERLLLRPLVPADREDLLAYRSDRETCRYVPFPPMDLVEIDRRMAGMWATRDLPEMAGENLTLGVEHEGRIIGDVILMRPAEPAGTVEIGYIFSPEVRGRGFATEACRPLLALAFDELGAHRVMGRLDARNTASARVLERLGLRLEAHFVEDEWFKGEWTSTLVYALLDREWRDGAGRSSSVP
ncbi:GNAT family N-acetyltransferase [Naasia sp. SYSU D00057]|uniref:GNAT family N-acetyltransferase n=1 Tax=Naasia sp. SYSU D00057 TaxID=2817380 RepID=UPI001B30E12A|nr:GNAT family N-acetyltransferase [Naasia sp. SYSU D00057]